MRTQEKITVSANIEYIISTKLKLFGPLLEFQVQRTASVSGSEQNDVVRVEFQAE